MWMLNSKGPNADPCGIPLVRERQLENCSPTLTLSGKTICEITSPTVNSYCY